MKLSLFAVPLLMLRTCSPNAHPNAPDTLPADFFDTHQPDPPKPDSDCLIEGITFGGVTRAEPKLSAHCKDRMAEGWKLVGVESGMLVWKR